MDKAGLREKKQGEEATSGTSESFGSSCQRQETPGCVASVSGHHIYGPGVDLKKQLLRGYLLTEQRE